MPVEVRVAPVTEIRVAPSEVVPDEVWTPVVGERLRDRCTFLWSCTPVVGGTR